MAHFDFKVRIDQRSKNKQFDQFEAAPAKMKFNLLTNDQQGPSDYDLLRTNCKAINQFKFVRDKKNKRMVSQSSSDNEKKPKPQVKRTPAKRKAPTEKKVSESKSSKTETPPDQSQKEQ